MMRKLQHTQEVQVIHEEEPWQKNKNQFNKDELKKEFKEFKKDSMKKSSVTCYNCNNLGHVKQECKLPKKHSKYSKMKNRKAMKVHGVIVMGQAWKMMKRQKRWQTYV